MARVFPPDPVSVAVGIEIRAEMIAKDITVTAMSPRIGVDRGTLGDWLGARRPMPLPALVSVAAELRLPAHELLRRAEDRARRSSTET